ncbi:MAG: DNA repair protein RecN [Oscillospiraceae bacterium]
MLRELHIGNIAVIELADIEFAQGLNVLTGETGAGKSIIIDAIDAVLGGRTSRELVRAGAEKCMVSAVFTVDEGVSAWCRENGVDLEDDFLVLHRRVTADGKSTCRVNGVPVSVSQLRSLGSMLLDIHGQNDGRQLMDETRHRDYLDRFGQLSGKLEEYRRIYERYRTTVREIEKLTIDEIEKERLIESLNYQIEELERANLRPGEEEELSARRELLKNAGKLTEAVDAAYSALYAADTSAVSLAQEASYVIGRAAEISSELEKARKSVDEAVYLLEDAAELLRDFRDRLDFSPEEYDALESRLALLRRLSRKYGGGEEEMLAHLEECRRRRDEIEYADDRLEKLRLELDELTRAAREAARGLTECRKRAAERLEARITRELRDLNMPSVRFKVEIKPLGGEPGFDSTGGDEVRFLMSANAGEDLGRISRIASGGELSRIMLAMKNVFAENDQVGTMVFDEIDAGVSGIAAQRVAEKLANLGRRKQVLCVTHLPQIAAMADAHFSIEKTERDGRTYTSVTLLDREGRRQELARLHGGDNITLTTLASAEEQLSAAERYKKATEF